MNHVSQHTGTVCRVHDRGSVRALKAIDPLEEDRLFLKAMFHEKTAILEGTGKLFQGNDS